uniref:(northern house mosquito) hypothetical protein n=1 Tax=Culex pipiens TaxID=7175 RepID=A0A8D8L2M6_CULPI
MPARLLLSSTDYDQHTHTTHLQHPHASPVPGPKRTVRVQPLRHQLLTATTAAASTADPQHQYQQHPPEPVRRPAATAANFAAATTSSFLRPNHPTARPAGPNVARFGQKLPELVQAIALAAPDQT